MSRFLIKSFVLILIAVVMFSSFAFIAAADENFTVSEPENSDSSVSAQQDIVVEKHPMQKYQWAYYVVAFISVAAVICAAVIISKKIK